MKVKQFSFGIKRRAVLLAVAVSALAACGGGRGFESTPEGPSTASAGGPSLVYKSAATAPTIACPTGGILVTSGIDSN